MVMFVFNFSVLHKDSYKRARIMKLVSIFFTASAEIFKVYLKDSEYCTV